MNTRKIPRTCFYISPTKSKTPDGRHQVDGGQKYADQWVPVIVTENTPGFILDSASGGLGDTFEEAEKNCARANKVINNLTEQDVIDIVASSMEASRKAGDESYEKQGTRVIAIGDAANTIDFDKLAGNGTRFKESEEWPAIVKTNPDSQPPELFAHIACRKCALEADTEYFGDNETWLPLYPSDLNPENASKVVGKKCRICDTVPFGIDEYCNQCGQAMETGTNHNNEPWWRCPNDNCPGKQSAKAIVLHNQHWFIIQRITIDSNTTIKFICQRKNTKNVEGLISVPVPAKHTTNENRVLCVPAGATAYAEDTATAGATSLTKTYSEYEAFEVIRDRDILDPSVDLNDIPVMPPEDEQPERMSPGVTLEMAMSVWETLEQTFDRDRELRLSTRTLDTLAMMADTIIKRYAEFDENEKPIVPIHHIWEMETVLNLYWGVIHKPRILDATVPRMPRSVEEAAHKVLVTCQAVGGRAWCFHELDGRYHVRIGNVSDKCNPTKFNYTLVFNEHGEHIPMPYIAQK